MASVLECVGTTEIGSTAGDIWHYLEENGPTKLAKLVKEINAPRDLIMQGIGWLAREDKICFENDGRKRVIALRF